MSEDAKAQPFQPLGARLKLIRQKLQESLAEVSGAVEIDEELLERFEHGAERPNEDLLMLLISHFGIRDDDAVNLWELAGYDTSRRPGATNDDNQSKAAPLTLLLALDARILYSDGFHVTANPSGIVVNFTQNAGQDNQAVPIARVGMSHEQAQNVMRVLSQALSGIEQLSQPKALPAPKNHKPQKPDAK
jgi:transcriptional regulator with XRE-family HTH domain